jgi:hypothetical protein
LMKAEGAALPTMVHRGPKPGTFRWLCVQFLDSAECKRLDVRTRAFST